jgi:hypothetical protein
VGSVPLGFVCAVLLPAPYGAVAFLALPAIAFVRLLRVKCPRCASPFVAPPFALLAERCSTCELVAFVAAPTAADIDPQVTTARTSARLARERRVLRGLAAWHVAAATVLLVITGLAWFVAHQPGRAELLLVGIIVALAFGTALLVWRGDPRGRHGVSVLLLMQAVAVALPGWGWRVQLGPFAGPLVTSEVVSLEVGFRIGAGLPSSPAPEAQVNLVVPAMLALVWRARRTLSA